MIAIIAILAAILFPVFSRAREKARQAVCLSNLKQLATAAMMYQQDYDGGYPNGADYRRPDPLCCYWYHRQLYTWHMHFQPYIRNWQAFHCPSAIRYWTRVGVWQLPARVSYGISYPIYWLTATAALGRGPDTPEACPYPADVVVIGDCLDDFGWAEGYAFSNFNGHWWELPRPYGYGEGPLREEEWARHSGGDDLIYLDGHVKWTRWQKLLAPCRGGNAKMWWPRNILTRPCPYDPNP